MKTEIKASAHFISKDFSFFIDGLPPKEGTYEPDFSKMVDYEKPSLN